MEASTGRRQSTGHLKGSAVMSAAATTTNTIRLHRVLRATPERIYRAFLDADAMAKWLPPNGFTAKVHHMDAKVGGTHRMSSTDFSTGKSHSFGRTYLELTPVRSLENKPLTRLRNVVERVESGA
jgi:uncharacterized protein YndB with AHSA1/START domain